MMCQDKTTGLTAAECATRTGLTTRALRVYEDYGLITPQRTSGGWRYYGERELIRLNTIALLKSAGLTLAQIRAATNLNDQDPSLQHVLKMQIDAWKAKQADAVRGQTIVEAALKSLAKHQSLSIDELCELVRSLEASGRAGDDTGDGETPEIVVDAKILDRYVGCYRYGEYSIFTVTREAHRLFGKLADRPSAEFKAQSEEEFIATDGSVQVRFVCEADGPATSMVFYHRQGFRATAQRLDADAVRDFEARLAAKIASQRPSPNSENALRRLLDGIRIGDPNYKEMSPALAQIIQQQLPVLQAIANYQGALQTIEFRGVGSQGWDVYEVRGEHGSCQWRISLNPTGSVESASTMLTDARIFSTTPAENPMSPAVDSPQEAASGAEAALRRMIDGIRNGTPNYEEMSPLLALSVRQQLPLFQTIGKQLGGVVAVEYKGSVMRRFDIFDLQREHGSARWRIAMGANGLIAEASAMMTGSTAAAGP